LPKFREELKDMLAYIREENRRRVEKCYYCDNKSEYFDAIEYKVISVCKSHFNFNTSS